MCRIAHMLHFNDEKGMHMRLNTTRASRPARILAALAAVIVTVAGLSLATAPAQAAIQGDALYSPSASNEGMAYARMIRLAHSGSANGQLISTFEHWTTDSTSTSYVIRRSSDDGATWSTISNVGSDVYMYQPFLYEFPTQLGDYPAGTLLLFGVTLPGDRSTTTLREWRSTDHGATWTSVGVVQSATGDDGSGIWEPAAGLDNNGNLVLYFSDERQSATWSQFLGHIVSTDGGVTWSANADGSTRVSPGEVKDVASSDQRDRPGMITVARNAVSGTYAATYEICGPKGCQVYYKTSTDGVTWGTGATDLGTAIATDDGRVLYSTPTIAWTPAGGTQGQFLVTAQREVRTAGGAPESGQVIFSNAADATGNWRWQPAPIRPTSGSGTSTCNPNYSPFLLVSADGKSIRYSAPGKTGTYGCTELTGSFNTGVLPYTADFSTGSPGWVEYNGTWGVSSGVLSETAGGTNGNKAVTGNTGWTDYTLTGDVKISSTSGNAGFLTRVTDPSAGTDSLKGYYIGVDGTNMVIGKQNYNWTALATKAIPGGLTAGSWYNLTVKVSGCSITVEGKPAGSSTVTSFSTSDCSFSHGSIGVRDFATGASWRNISVS